MFPSLRSLPSSEFVKFGITNQHALSDKIVLLPRVKFADLHNNIVNFHVVIYGITPLIVDKVDDQNSIVKLISNLRLNLK